MCLGSLHAVMWLADEPREFNLPTLSSGYNLRGRDVGSKYGVHSEEYVPIRTITPVVAGIPLYRRPPEAADSLDRPPWNVAKRRWMASAMAPEADLLGGGVSPRTDREALGEVAEAGMENTEILLEASKEIGLEVNPEKTKYMIMSRDQNIVRNGNIKIGDLSFEEVEKFKYLGATVTNINDIREEIKRRINMGNACYYSVEKLLSSSLLSKNLKVRIYKTVLLPVLLYGCETWTLTLREEHRLRVFENKMLRKIFGAKRDEVTGIWRKLHNAELHALYSSPDIIRNIKSRRLRWAGHVARMGESRNAYRVLVGRPEGKRPLGRPRRRWEDNITMDLREVGYDDRDWIGLAQDRDQWRAYVRAAMNLRNRNSAERVEKCIRKLRHRHAESLLPTKSYVHAIIRKWSIKDSVLDEERKKILDRRKVSPYPEKINRLYKMELDHSSPSSSGEEIMQKHKELRAREYFEKGIFALSIMLLMSFRPAQIEDDDYDDDDDDDDDDDGSSDFISTHFLCDVLLQCFSIA
ncbi:hypothetical protein ANN_20772 [Periplaneta americana]|uniref:Endonuclease-reverse transcriptase n=1 Tax=Periplaneta americana TaxID=6978 RepID=A0ABQ8SEP7_PERAM|nr:hypothetical protein ANN_20772 [Periplaneta americana]